MPVQALNELRREALEQMEEKLLQPFRRTAGAVESQDEGENERSEQQSETGSVEAGSCGLHISIEEPCLLPIAIAHPDVTRIYLDSCGLGPETWKVAVQACHDNAKQCSLMLPHGGYSYGIGRKSLCPEPSGKRADGRPWNFPHDPSAGVKQPGAGDTGLCGDGTLCVRLSSGYGVGPVHRKDYKGLYETAGGLKDEGSHRKRSSSEESLPVLL